MKRNLAFGASIFGGGLAVAIAVTALVGLMAAVSVWSSLRSQEAARERRASFERRAAIEQLLGAMRDAETGQRGYLLTQDTAFLQPYRAVAGSFAGRLDSLRAAFATGTRGAPGLGELDSLVRFKVDLLERTIELQRAGQRAATLALVSSAAGKRAMDQIRVIVASMVQEEQALVDLWDARLQAASRLSLVTNGAGAFLTIVFLLVGIGAIRRSISRREAAESALRESEQRLVSLIEALPVAVYVLDRDGKPFYANQASSHMLGKGLDPGSSAGELSQLYSVYSAGTGDAYPADRLPIVRALAGEKVYVEDVEIHRPDRVVPLEVWAAPVRDSNGQVAFAVAVFSDITERKAAREEIRNLNALLSRRVDELTEVNRELEAFTYSVSHDLRAPVRHIDGFSRLLADHLGETNGQGKHYLTRIRDGARQMGALIDDLLRLSRVSRQELQAEKVDLNALLRSVVFDLREEAGGREVEWRIQKLPAIRGDARLLKQVFINLVSNALKFTRTRPQAVVEIGEEPADGGQAIYIRDNGVGFDMKYSEKLFGVFQRLHLAEEFPGTGVGLAIVHRIVRKHGGHIWAEAELDKGATFRFTLGSAAVPVSRESQ